MGKASPKSNNEVRDAVIRGLRNSLVIMEQSHTNTTKQLEATNAEAMRMSLRADEARRVARCLAEAIGIMSAWEEK